MVSLNNRIYFRDQPSPGLHIDGSHGVESDPSRGTGIASFQLSPIRSHVHRTMPDDSYKLNTISHTIDLEKGSKGDAVSISSDPRY
jgi:hypothetical protein